MNRRAYLSAASASVCALAGCLNGGEGESQSEPPVTCPPPAFGDQRPQLCAETAVASSSARLATFGEDSTDGVQLRNLGSDPVEFNPAGWAIHEWTDSGWEHVAPDVRFDPIRTLDADDRYRWYLDKSPDDTAEHILDVSIGTGRFAFSLDVVGNGTGNTYSVLFRRA